MADLARKAANDVNFKRRLAETLLRWREWTAGVDDLTELDTFIRGHFHYRPEREEVVRTPHFMITELQETGKFEGDCDDVSTMLAAIARSFGYPVRYVAIRSKETFEHVFVEIYDSGSGKWRIFDPTVDKGTDYKIVEKVVVSV